ncbi:uncharacterized protein M421DRAFT_51965 [Didymella exigua CBS 183.55]|uniref:Spindle pole body-associated protein cut12 domain-containing protein n=1 Tax=Didymella exigua CBS 183.55 TaxID=1150837 RepID=A0A6A5S114_9PLEO|nr:uncharacterized protein M421DRAFT_51965 [Didymella exigua CBS 183.55]KAF1933573.1 hypothetical protein M421DRAFT_51965 [Didymella exigua CBS 183.55]
MFSWITGPRITNVIEDLQAAEPAYESTFIDPPETPAHQFAVKAFKQAIFGTPAPEDLNNATRKFETKAKIAAVNAKITELPAPKHDDFSQSPAKRANGILMTPGTSSKGRKTVSFGSQIEDNEGKTGGIIRSGIPNNCPGKFPSPWTPGTELKLDSASDKRPRTRLTEALLDARTTTQPKSGQMLKARDDSDITMDLGAPRSESGKYWKDQYESYAERSEREMKKVVAKQQLAKKFAMKKDGEVTELAQKLEQERKRFRSREKELEQQNKDYQERLRQAMAENTSTSMENAALKLRISTLEKSVATTTVSAQVKPDFSIHEDASKEAIQLQKESEAAVQASFAASFGKENSTPPRSRRTHRRTVPDTADRTGAPSKLGTAKGEASIILANSPAFPTEFKKPLEPPQSARFSRTPLSIRRASPAKDNAGPSSPVPVLPSSPLPMPSPDLPDPWMNMDESSIPQLDKRAMPTAGSPYVNPAWNPPARKQRESKSTSQPVGPETQATRRQMDKVSAKTGAAKTSSHVAGKSSLDLEARLAALSSKASKKQQTDKSETDTPKHSPTDPKFDLSKITSHHAEGSAQVKHDRAEMLPVDRKAEARRRLEERKKLRKAAPA